MKKLTSFLALLLVFSFCFTLPIAADDGFYRKKDTSINNSTYKNQSPNFETIVTWNNSGTITENTFYYPDSEVVNHAIAATSISSSPDLSADSSRATTPDRYRTTVDNRVGLLVAEFDTDNDGDLDEAVKSHTTASIVGHDILLASAHGVWKKRYQQGFSQKTTFFAGRNSLLFTVKTDCINLSISMNYINQTQLVIDADGNISDEVPEFQYDWSIIQTEKNLSDTCGYFAFQQWNGTSNAITNVYTKGYGEDGSNYYQWTSYGTVVGFDGNCVDVNIDAYPGNSGGPLLYNDLLYGTLDYMYVGRIREGGGLRIYYGLYTMLIDAKEQSAERWE